MNVMNHQEETEAAAEDRGEDGKQAAAGRVHSRREVHHEDDGKGVQDDPHVRRQVADRAGGQGGVAFSFYFYF